MEIVIAKHAGFCKGVQNAVNTAMTISPENTYVYGEIIHNIKEWSAHIVHEGLRFVVPKGVSL